MDSALPAKANFAAFQKNRMTSRLSHPGPPRPTMVAQMLMANR